MLKVRIIPTLLLKGETLVKGIGFDSWRRVGTLLPAIKVYNTRQVDELVLLDITATCEGRPPDFETISDISGECFVPLTVGGGVTDLNVIKQLLRGGADKVAINTRSFSDPEFISAAANRFGSQCIVASIDVRRNQTGEYECYSHSGSKPTGKFVESWAQEMERRGAGEILLTSIENDGTMSGFDMQLIRKVTDAVNIPVIASGGAGNYRHFLEAIVSGRASAVAAASMYHFSEQTPLEAKAFLAQNGIAVRNSRMTNV